MYFCFFEIISLLKKAWPFIFDKMEIYLGHLCNSGDLLIWVDVLRRPLTTSSEELLGQSYPNMVHICSICRVRRQELVNFMTTHFKGKYFWRKKCKIDVFSKKNLLYPRAWFRQNKCIVMITKKWYTKIVNFMTPGAGVLRLGRGHMSYSENALYL